MTRISTVEEGYAWCESYSRIDRGGYAPRRHRLARMRALLAGFDNPHLDRPVIHVAGSKGKGSTAAYLGFLLHAAGKRVGIYASPHVESYRERVRVLDGALTDEAAVAVFRDMQRYVERAHAHTPQARLPTTFELLTLFGFLAFRAAECDVSIVEVGIGGRVDATNLVRPIASVITPVELEHTEYLGKTYRSVAAEKGGAIKRRTPVFVGRQRQEAMTTLRRVAELRGAPLVALEEELTEAETGHGSPSERPYGEPGHQMSDADPGRIVAPVRLRFRDGLAVTARLRLLGRVQTDNAALAVTVVRSVFPAIERATIEAGLANAWLPGRSELVPGNPPVLLDGAHTERSIAELCRTACSVRPERDRRVAVFGAVSGKNHEAMLRLLIERFGAIIIARPGTFKQSDTGALVTLCRRLGGHCALHTEPADALTAARNALASDEGALSSAERALSATAPSPGEGLIVVTGSFYLVGEVRALLHTDRRNEGDA
jgi:dihydrofolate synthase/folylpolyglutamate synthase